MHKQDFRYAPLNRGCYLCRHYYYLNHCAWDPPLEEIGCSTCFLYKKFKEWEEYEERFTDDGK